MPRHPEGYTEQHVKQVPYCGSPSQSADAGAPLSSVMAINAVRQSRALAPAIALSFSAASACWTQSLMKKNHTAQQRMAAEPTKNSTCILRLTSSCWGLALLQAHAGAVINAFINKLDSSDFKCAIPLIQR